MKTEQEIRDRLAELQKTDDDCPYCKRQSICMDFGHGIRSTQKEVLEWLLDELKEEKANDK